jgi:hypothetical protein
VINARQLLADLQAQQKKLENDLRQQTEALPELKARLQAEYAAARDAGRTADTYGIWRDHQVTQSAVAWVLACTFVRFAEDTGLLPTPRLSGPGDALRRARDAFGEFVRQRPTDHERHYLESVFDGLAEFPALTGLFGRAHNPLFAIPPTYEAARDLLAFWQQTDPDSGALRHDFSDPEFDTRFLGDLYQDLSDAARKRYALLQTPEFVEELILDRTLEPAIKAFGLDVIRLIDPTCGSGHFLLGAFQRLLDHWQRSVPGMDARQRVLKALAGVYGVDLNPFAVAIARFRLLVAALRASGIRTLREAPGWKFNVTTGDSLLHGRRLGEGELDYEQTGIAAEYAHVYAAEDHDELHRILGQRYHAVVGNPPYITASDSALNALYRERYETCHRKFSLGVPFTERFFQLAETNGDTPAGYVGLITADSFMKREFGKKLIEDWFPRQDLTHLIHTSGAYIPGHGTPTVILFGRNRAPVARTVRAVLGIRGEPSTPEDPAQGLVWRSIVDLTDRPGTSNEYISVADMARDRLDRHPWSLQGGSAPDALAAIESATAAKLSASIDVIGRTTHTGEDDVFYMSPHVAQRFGSSHQFVDLVVGEDIRDWLIQPVEVTLLPYNIETAERLPELPPDVAMHMWCYRASLKSRRDFGQFIEERGLPWYEHSMFFPERFRRKLGIAFAFVATHNHFVLDRGGKVFNRTAPVIKLPAGASEDEHLGLLGLLNSATACFWMKQVCFNKGMGEEHWADRFEHDGSKVGAFPLIEERPLELTQQLDTLAREHDSHLPAGLAPGLPLSRAELDEHRAQADALFARMVALQDELDWWSYRAYGLLDDDVTFASEPPGIVPGQRAFEIVLARRLNAGEVETKWFERHGSSPITEAPADWPAEYRALVERRIALIESHPWIGLLERPEYKRRWNQPGWRELEQAALRGWLLDRLEAPAYWPEPALQRIGDLFARAERDADFMAVATLYTGQPAFNLASLLRDLLDGESVPALKVLRYKPTGLRKRDDWEQTWAQQRREDAIDAAVAAEYPRRDDEEEAQWRARIKPEQDKRKLAEVGRLPAPPKYTSADFLKPAYWRLRGGLDVPKERCFVVPDPQALGDWLYGWAGWNPARRVRALAGAWIDGLERSGADPAQLLPLLVAIDEELPWVLQWHNAIDPDTDVRPGDYFRDWLAQQLNQQHWTRQTLAEWQPPAAGRRGGKPRIAH